MNEIIISIPDSQQKSSSSAENSLNESEAVTEKIQGGGLLGSESLPKKWSRNIIDNDVLDDSFTRNDNVKNSIADLKGIFTEEQEIIEKMIDLSNSANTLERFKDLFEALYFEFSIRKADKLKILDKINQREEQTQEDLRFLEESLNKVQNEMQSVKAYQINKTLRHTGTFKIKSEESFKYSEMYDWVIDIDLLTSITKEGWPVRFNQNLKKILLNTGEKEVNSYDKWDGAIVAVVGLYDKGKTFVLNNLTKSNLPSGKKVNTKGLSFKHVDVEQGTKLILLDTAGSYSPVKIVSELSVIEKEATELFILDIVFELSDYFICVVNDFTSLDQRYLDKLSRNLQNASTKSFREIIVVHNLKEVESGEILEHLWKTQVTQIYGSGSIQRTKVAAVNPINNCLQEKHVVWFKTAYSRHVCLANDDSVLGATINPWTFSLLKYWLKAVIVPVNRDFSVVESVLSISNHKLSSYFKTPIALGIKDTDQLDLKLIKATNPIEKMSIPQVSIDSSGYITTSPDSFLPKVDIIKDEKYCIFLEVPGLRKEDLILYRQNVMTIVKGCKNKPYEGKDLIIEKNERKYGDFTMTFKIPENYERRWSSYEVKNGVLEIVYDKDTDDYEKSDKGITEILSYN